MPRQNTTTRPGLKQLEQTWLVDVGDYINDIDWSPDGRRLVVSSANGMVTCLDGVSGESINSWSAHELGTLSARWSADGTLLATAGQDGKATILDGKTLLQLVALDHGSVWVEHLAWSPRNNLLLTAAGKILRLWNSDGSLVEEFEPHDSTISGVQWNPAATDIFATSCYGGVRLWRLGTNTPKRKLQWKGSLLNLEYAPNGKVIACGCQDGAVHFWVLPNGDDLEMSGYPTKIRELAWDHKSRFLATGGGEDVVVWDFSGKGPEGSKPAMLAGHESFVSFLAFQPKGSFLASGGFDGRLFIWNPSASQSPVAHVELDSEISKLSWQLDGTALASGQACGAVRLWNIQ